MGCMGRAEGGMPPGWRGLPFGLYPPGRSGLPPRLPPRPGSTPGVPPRPLLWGRPSFTAAEREGIAEERTPGAAEGRPAVVGVLLRREEGAARVPVREEL